MVPLFTNMKEAGEVAAKLKENKVNYEIQEGGQGNDDPRSCQEASTVSP